MKRLCTAANLVTFVRVLCAAALLFCRTFSAPFYALYAAGFLSDALDGPLARRRGEATAFGARLDTAADMAFLGVVTVKTALAAHLPLWVLFWAGGIAAVKLFSLIYGLTAQRRFPALHTRLNKVCGGLLFLLPLCAGLFPGRPTVMLSALTCAAASFAALQEGRRVRRGEEIR